MGFVVPLKAVSSSRAVAASKEIDAVAGRMAALAKRKDLGFSLILHGYA
jgi:predicted deacetylase